MPFDYDKFYSPWVRRRKAAQASPENPATTGVPNPARSDPYPRYDPDAPARRAIGAVAYGEMSGYEPRTAAELEEASGVDRRIPDAPNSFGPVRRGAAGSRLVEGTGGAYGYTNGSVEGLYPYGTRTTPAPGGLAGALLSSDRGGVSPAEAAKRWEDLQLEGYARNRNNSYYEQSYGTAAAEDAIARGRLKVPTLAQSELVRAEAEGDAAAVERLRPLVEEQQARIFGRRQEYLEGQASDNSLAYHERLGLGAMRSAEAEEAATRRREAEAARMADAELAAQTERARIAAGVPISFGGGAGAIPNADGGWAVSRPEPAPVATPAPAPVSFGAGAGAIPEIGKDGRPTGRYVYQAPTTETKPVPMDAETPGMFFGGKWVDNPGYNPKPIPVGGTGVGKWNPETKSYDVTFPGKDDGKGARAVTLKPGESYYDPETKETFVAPGMDYVSIQAEIAGWQAAYARTESGKTRKEIGKKIADAQARLAALGTPAPAPAPQPAAERPAQPAQPEPAPAPAQPEPAPAPAAPPGFRRMPNGELEYVG